MLPNTEFLVCVSIRMVTGYREITEELRTELNRTHLISNVYIVHSFQHWHLHHILY